MRTRIVVAAIGIPLIFAVIIWMPPSVFGLVTGITASISAYELLRIVLPKLKRRQLIYAMTSALVIPLSVSFHLWNVFTSASAYLLMIVMFYEMMLSFQREHPLRLEELATVIFAGSIIPLLLASLLRLRHQFAGIENMIIPLLVTFASDSGAYFTGTFLGRHKLLPSVSPGKTIEGSIGGFASGIVIMLLYGLTLSLLGYTVSFAALGIYGFLGSLACQTGDLSFSAIKRVCGVKDFGELIPGHGGMLDRFDGMIFTAPMLELLVMWAPAITGIPG